MKQYYFTRNICHAWHYAGVDPQHPAKIILEFSAIGKRFHLHKSFRGAVLDGPLDRFLRNFVFDLSPCNEVDCPHNLQTDGSPAKPLVITLGEAQQ